MATVTLGSGRQLHYLEDDFTDPWKTSPVVLLHHGFGRSSRFWYSWVPTLSRECRVLRLDGRGFGMSSLPDDFDGVFRVEDFVEDVIALLYELGIEKVHFGGESFGGIIGGVMAATHPHRVQTLTLVSSPTRVHEEGQAISALGRPSYLEAVMELGPLEWARQTNSFRFPADTDPGLKDWYAREMGKTNPEAMYGLIRLFATADLAPFLPNIQCPTLLLYPDAGKYSSERPIFEEHVRDLRVDVVAATSHSIATLHPEYCANSMLQLIRDHDTEPRRVL